MTEEKFNELAAQVEANTRAIEELKEAFATLDQGMATQAENNSLIQALEELADEVNSLKASAVCGSFSNGTLSLTNGA